MAPLPLPPARAGLGHMRGVRLPSCPRASTSPEGLRGEERPVGTIRGFGTRGCDFPVTFSVFGKPLPTAEAPLRGLFFLPPLLVRKGHFSKAIRITPCWSYLPGLLRGFPAGFPGSPGVELSMAFQAKVRRKDFFSQPADVQKVIMGGCGILG